KKNKKPAKLTDKRANGFQKEKVVVAKLPKGKLPTPPKLCHVCGKVYKNNTDLVLHEQTKHNQVSNLKAKCPQCQKYFVSKYNLKKHLKRVHAKQKEFVCTICSKAFAFNNELGKHMSSVHYKNYGGKKTFSCQLCKRVFSIEKSLIIHVRSVHTGERPAVCSVCDSSFYHEEYLKKHMRLHTGETPFKCPVCGRGYAQRGNMKSHLRNHRRSELDSETLSKMRPNYLRFLKP
ncbi:gastrula zinc finger protein XlCGF62.1-like, partial [Aricia agestis]|uniref:gastrula zinc finger protein XlCGF62.1-like n=1 Tax=Aricia agestis TaxID=91739 RepID=UPI001C20719C